MWVEGVELGRGLIRSRGPPWLGIWEAPWRRTSCMGPCQVVKILMECCSRSKAQTEQRWGPR